jgi:hypothetical protein
MKSLFWIAIVIIVAVCIGVATSKAPTKSSSKSSDKSEPQYNYVYFIRHGEKTTDKDFGLSPIGFSHAHCLSKDYFKNFPHGAPRYAIAKMSNTERPIETATIIANKLGIQSTDLSARLKIKGTADLILDKLAEHHRVLVVWENNAIPKLAQALGCKNCKSWNWDPTSKKHDAHLFNSTWVLRFPRQKSYNLDEINELDVKFQDFDQNFNGTDCHPHAQYIHRNF